MYSTVPAPSHGPVESGKDRIVLHGTVSPCRAGQAPADARYIAGVGYSVHYVIDPGGICPQLPEPYEGWGDGHNVREIHVEFCDPQAGDPARWADADHQRMLALGAPLVRAIAGRWHIPSVRIRAPLGTLRGICGHIDTSQTWHQSTHVDPDKAGPFPWDAFIRQVNGQEDMSIVDPATKSYLDALHNDLNSRIGTSYNGLTARLAALEAAVTASPDTPVSQAQLDEAVAKGLAAAHITITPGGTPA